MKEHNCTKCNKPCDGEDCKVLSECNYCIVCGDEIEAYHDAMLDDSAFIEELTKALNDKSIARVLKDPKEV